LSSVDATVLYERFLAARCRAIEATDTFRGLDSTDSRRAHAWNHVVERTEVARLLLVEWLGCSP